MIMIGALMLLAGTAVGVPLMIAIVVADITKGYVPYQLKLWMCWCATVIAAGACIMWAGGGR